MPDAPGLELILAELNRTHPGAVLDTGYDREQAALIVDPEQILAVLTWLRDTPGQEYDFLSSVHGVDYLPAQPRFAVHYELINRDRYERLRIKALLDDPAVMEEGPSESEGDSGDGGAPVAASPGMPAEERLPHLDSCVELFPTAEFQERETFDFFGIVFDGHPDLRRIFMPEDYVGWPQRRDFPVGGEPVIFTRDEAASPGWWR